MPDSLLEFRLGQGKLMAERVSVAVTALIKTSSKLEAGEFWASDEAEYQLRVRQARKRVDDAISAAIQEAVTSAKEEMSEQMDEKIRHASKKTFQRAQAEIMIEIERSRFKWPLIDRLLKRSGRATP